MLILAPILQHISFALSYSDGTLETMLTCCLFQHGLGIPAIVYFQLD